MSSILTTLEDLEDAIESGLSAQELLETWDSERDKKNRKGALELIGDQLHHLVKEGGSDSADCSEAEAKAESLEAELKAAQDQIIVLERRLEEQKSIPASIASKSEYKSFSSMFNKDGVFVIAPLHEVERWQSLSKITKYVLDVKGEHALALCSQFPHHYDELSDGTFRIQTPSVRVARVLENKIRNMCANRKWTGMTMSLMSLGTSECIAKDAVRGGGLAQMREMCILGASSNITVESSYSEDGSSSGLKISWK